MKKLEEMGLVPLNKKESLELFGGIANIWETIVESFYFFVGGRIGNSHSIE